MKTRINGLELEYSDFGGGPAVLCIHDCPTGQALPEDLFRPLAEAGYRVITTRLNGLGEMPAEGFDPSLHARGAISLLNYLGIGRAVILGIGLGGYVLVDLLEKFPGRVAASSLVVGAAAARKIRRLAKRADIRLALQEGRLEEIKTFLMAALPTERGERSAPPALNHLRAWINRVRSRNLQAPAGRKEFSTLLAEIDLPPLLVEESGSPPSPGKGTAAAQGRSIAARGWRKIKGLNAHLLALLDFLLPKDEDLDEEEILTDLG